MLKVFVSVAMNALMSVLTPELIRGFIQAGVAKISEHVAATKNKTDDILIPALNLVMSALDIPGPDGKIDISSELTKLFFALGAQKNEFIDAGLDWIENNIEATENKIDDMVVLPMCSLVRTVLNVPDNDE
jgi:hypothetical protein